MTDETGTSKPKPSSTTEENGDAQLSKKAAKKAAKKAEAKAKKSGSDAGDSKAAGTQKKNASNKSAGGAGTSASNTKIVAVVVNKLKSFELAFNPNAPLATRWSPVIALSTAVLCNMAPDLTLTSNHKRAECSIGTENGGAVTGDVAIAKYLARCAQDENLVRELLGGSLEEQGCVDMWLTYGSEMRVLDTDDDTVKRKKAEAIARTIEGVLASEKATFLAGNSFTLADVAAYAALGFSAECVSNIPKECSQARRWAQQMSVSVPLLEAQQLALSIGQFSSLDANSVLEPLEEGMNSLEGALPGRVVTRFPPEPSGYLHIGHAKAVLLNDYYARRYQGKLIVRYDDTNPSKEKEEFQQAIIDDLKTLGVYPDKVTHTSDYFGAIHQFAVQLIKGGLAFMDDTPQEKMQAERLAREESVHRDQTVEEALHLFDIMCSGKPEGAAWCLRAKIDMKSVNGTLRDPVLYRQNLTPHHNTGTTFKAYPTYDLACPIVDSLEGVTHALRTTEYTDRDEQYAWIQKACKLRRSRIHAFSRLNFINTELSKRKLTWFVENNIVTGWDDARFPTIRGVTRRGLNVAALRKFIYMQGASRRVVLMEWTKFWAENKKQIDGNAKRYIAIAADPNDNCVLKITNYDSVIGSSLPSYVTTDFHPKNPSLGQRVVKLSEKVLLERIDFEGVSVGEEVGKSIYCVFSPRSVSIHS